MQPLYPLQPHNPKTRVKCLDGKVRLTTEPYSYSFGELGEIREKRTCPRPRVLGEESKYEEIRLTNPLN